MSSAEQPSYCVALIHNNHESRNGYALPQLRALCKALEAAFLPVSWQPALQTHSYATALRRDLLYLFLELRWARYRLLPFSESMRIIKGYVLHKLPKYLRNGKKLKDWRRRSFIETVVTAKHIAAWQQFLESEHGSVICFEDDVVFNVDSVDRIERALKNELASKGNSRLYADLGGGLSEIELRIGRLVDGNEGDTISYRYPTTNTACAYLLSRGMAAEFMRQILVNPVLRLIGIDWMMNAMFMQQKKDGDVCRCVHFTPSIFGHGTLTGEYVSWQRSMESG